MVKSIILQIVIFIFIFIGLYVLLLFVLGAVHVNNKSLLSAVTDFTGEPGGEGHTLQRFREIEKTGNVDIVFLGFSHVYRGFDPRIFLKHGLTSFNMGSSSQTPLNSYFLLKRYLDRLKPKLVVFEVSPVILSLDGMESFYDLLRNVTYSPEMLEMALALKNINALHAVIYSKIFTNGTLDTAVQKEGTFYDYVPGGYCESRLTNNTHTFKKEKLSYPIVDNQASYVKKILKYAHSNNIKVLLISQPLPPEYASNITNIVEIESLLNKTATDEGAVYIDYTHSADFDTNIDFYDYTHMTHRGVIKYNNMLLNYMTRHGLVQ